MLFTLCPNCQHDNLPGERFCASCGVPLDLKPCPVCGKVTEAGTTVCAGCGAMFPPISVEITTVDDLGPPTVPMEISFGSPARKIRALSLAVIAVAAIGIPILWFFRDEMPIPDIWNSDESDSARVVSTTPPERISPPKQEIPPAPPVSEPSTSAGNTQPEIPAEAPKLPEEKPVEEAITAPPPVQTPSISPKPKTASADTAVTPASRTAKKPASKPQQAPRARNDCTEALAAVGLCQRKSAQ